MALSKQQISNIVTMMVVLALSAIVGYALSIQFSKTMNPSIVPLPPGLSEVEIVRKAKGEIPGISETAVRTNFQKFIQGASVQPLNARKSGTETDTAEIRYADGTLREFMIWLKCVEVSENDQPVELYRKASAAHRILRKYSRNRSLQLAAEYRKEEARKEESRSGKESASSPLPTPEDRLKLIAVAEYALRAEADRIRLRREKPAEYHPSPDQYYFDRFTLDQIDQLQAKRADFIRFVMERDD